jgi:lathosterol oxidase
MAFFLGVGFLIPRRTQGLWIQETVVNVLTGGFLFLVRLLLLALTAKVSFETSGLIDGALLTHPALQFLLAFIVLDLARYAVHYADHRVPFLWKFHRVHHSSERLNATSGLRMHVVDLLQLTAIPLVVFGWVLDTSSFALWVVPGALSLGILFDCFQHANIAMDMTKPRNRLFNLVFNNPHFHSWHHTQDGHLRDGNYGNVLVIWDRLFKTDVTQDHLPEAFGLPKEQQLEQGVLGLQRLRLQSDL